MKKLIAYTFILIFSFQIIPIKEIGAILFKGQITEEEVHNCCNKGEDNLKLKRDGDPLNMISSTDQNNSRIAYLNTILLTAIHNAENLPVDFVPDIITPPPNLS